MPKFEWPEYTGQPSGVADSKKKVKALTSGKPGRSKGGGALNPGGRSNVRRKQYIPSRADIPHVRLGETKKDFLIINKDKYPAGRTNRTINMNTFTLGLVKGWKQKNAELKAVTQGQAYFDVSKSRDGKKTTIQEMSAYDILASRAHKTAFRNIGVLAASAALVTTFSGSELPGPVKAATSYVSTFAGGEGSPDEPAAPGRVVVEGGDKQAAKTKTYAAGRIICGNTTMKVTIGAKHDGLLDAAEDLVPGSKSQNFEYAPMPDDLEKAFVADLAKLNGGNLADEAGESAKMPVNCEVKE